MDEHEYKVRAEALQAALRVGLDGRSDDTDTIIASAEKFTAFLKGDAKQGDK